MRFFKRLKNAMNSGKYEKLMVQNQGEVFRLP